MLASETSNFPNLKYKMLSNSLCTYVFIIMKIQLIIKIIWNSYLIGSIEMISLFINNENNILRIGKIYYHEGRNFSH